MTLTPGSRLGVFELAELLGRGGMGEVYRATDTKLKRQVAIKVLPPSMVADRDRLARFQREAEVLASLNHPNIAGIHGLEESDGITALVMELVEGDDLAQRIAQGAISIDEALPIAKQIAEALEAAHEQGIIHRDLKPANIKVRSDGTVKILDFGLAKAMEPAAGSSPNMSMSPTLTTPAMTQAGMILGTAAYMSPEQAKGRTVDRRADIWAFGCVLFEMLTGMRAFAGADVQETFVALMRDEPDWTRLPAAVPPSLVTYLKRCLQKEAKQRVQAIGDVRLALEGAFETAAPQTGPTALSTSRGRTAWMVAAAAVVGMIALAVPAVRHLRETAPPESRVDIATPTTDQPASFALSPDGRQIVFLASADGASRLWLRSLAATTAQPLAGTDNARLPFWAPSGQSIGFFSDDTLKRLDLGGGPPQSLAPVSSATGGTWSRDDVILFVGNTTPLMRVSATGGTAVAVTSLGPQQAAHREPWFLPDGRRFLFYVLGTPETSGIYLGALDGGAPVRLTPADSAGVYLGAGWLLWARAGALVAQQLDLGRAALTGEPVTIADGIAVDAAMNRSAVSVAATGLVAYRTGTGGQRQLTWLDRSGTVRGTIGDPDGSLVAPRVSPDGRLVVVNRDMQGNRDLWLLDGTRATRLTFDAARDEFPVWSPDGARIAFRSLRTGRFDLYQYTRAGNVEEQIFASDQLKFASSWSPDGRFLLFSNIDPQTGYDLMALPMWGERPSTGSASPPPAAGRTPFPVVKTPFMERWGAFSPDGRWVAYVSNESGRNEIYARAFVPPGAAVPAVATTDQRWQVSTAGGIYPAWRPDGRELYYLNATGAMMAAPVNGTGTKFETGAPLMLFSARIFGGVDPAVGRQYDVAPDGRFLVNAVLDNTAPPITLVQNWNPETKK